MGWGKKGEEQEREGFANQRSKSIYIGACRCSSFIQGAQMASYKNPKTKEISVQSRLEREDNPAE